jgi:hypothetical protein
VRSMVATVAESLGGLDVARCESPLNLNRLYITASLWIVTNAGICFGKSLLDGKFHSSLSAI